MLSGEDEVSTVRGGASSASARRQSNDRSPFQTEYEQNIQGVLQLFEQTNQVVFRSKQNECYITSTDSQTIRNQTTITLCMVPASLLVKVPGVPPSSNNLINSNNVYKCSICAGAILFIVGLSWIPLYQIIHSKISALFI